MRESWKRDSVRCGGRGVRESDRGIDVDLLQSEITLVEDVPCRACGYNLRGLTLPGRCPECGENLDYSVQEFDAARHLTLPVDRGWAGQILEGARLSLISFGLIVAVSFAPGWMWESKKPGRVCCLLPRPHGGCLPCTAC